MRTSLFFLKAFFQKVSLSVDLNGSIMCSDALLKLLCLIWQVLKIVPAGKIVND